MHAAGRAGERLRREGLYTSHLTYWRKQRRGGAPRGLGQTRGRKPADRRDAEIADLRRRAAAVAVGARHAIRNVYRAPGRRRRYPRAPRPLRPRPRSARALTDGERSAVPAEL